MEAEGADVSLEQAAMDAILQLQSIYAKSKLYDALEYLMGRPASVEQSEAYYDDVNGLISLYHEKQAEFSSRVAAGAASADDRAAFIEAALMDAINGDEADEQPEVSHESIRQLHHILKVTLTPSNVETGVAVGAMCVAAEAQRAADENLRRELRQQRQQAEQESAAASIAARKADMKVSPEVIFRLAQHVRSGLADEAELLQIRNEEEDGEDVELNEEEPAFLRRAGLPAFKRKINYRALLPSQQLREARTPQQRQAILDRVAQRQSGDPRRLTTMELAAQQQLKINSDRRMIASRQRRMQHEAQRENEDGGGPTTAAAAGDAREENDGTLLHTELDEKPEEAGFRPRDLPARLPPWMKHSFGRHPQFGYPQSSQSIDEQRRSLPIFAMREALLQHVGGHSVTVLVGETGSGKTTQIPQYLAEHGYTKNGIIACTQPRRVAAETLAARVAEESHCRLGEEVGYTVRFRDVTSSLTKIKFMTDGMLLREALLDDSFQRYSVLMLDEAHERSISTDLLFAIVRNALRKHPSLKVLVTSATLETTKFCKYFGVAEPFMIPGRTFPVETYYLTAPTSDYVRTALQTVMKLHLEEPPGDVLVFFTGQEEIELGGEQLYAWLEALRRQAHTPLPDLMVLPLTATMPQDVQSRVFERTPPGCRKVVLATNVAETSITIDNLYYVIDSGFCKQSVFDPRTGIEQLRIVPVAQAQARQRAGRAGRIGPGKCFRMYTEAQFKNELPLETVPDIMRANLFHVALQLKAMGVDLFSLELMDAPSPEALVAALEKLRYLEALDDDGLLTPLGGRMAQLSIDPSQSKTLLTAVDFGCSEPVLTIVSMLAVQKRGVFYRPRDRQAAADAAKRQFYQPEGDQLTLMVVYDAWIENGMSEDWCRQNFLKHRMLVEARDTRDQLKSMLTRRNTTISHANDHNLTEVRRALTAGYFFNAARRVDSHARSYVTMADRREVYMHPSSVLVDDPPKYVLYDDLRMTTREYMSELLVIEPQWLVELAPSFYSRPKKGRRLTRAQEAERFTPILRSWETGSSWRISKLRKQRG